MRKTWFIPAAILFILSAGLLFSDPASAAGEKYSIATASPGGTFYAYGGGWSNLLNQKLGFNTSTQVTGGGVDNAILLGNKKVHFGMTTTGEALIGFRGTAKWAQGKKFDNMRVLFMTHPAVLHLLSKASNPVNSIRDLEGKRVSLGPAGSGHDSTYRLIFDILKIKPARINNLPFGDSIRQLGDGRIDSICMTVGFPNSSVMRFDVSHKAQLAAIAGDDAKNLLKDERASYLTPFEIPANTYKSITKPIQTLAQWAMMATDKDLPADVIYRIMKVTYDNQKTLIAAHKAAKFLDMNRVLVSPIPIHAGAVRYYREKGLKIPARLIPPEFK